MDQPVRLGLVFPLSGQRLFVEVPRRLAQAAGKLAECDNEEIPRSVDWSPDERGSDSRHETP